MLKRNLPPQSIATSSKPFDPKGEWSSDMALMNGLSALYIAYGQFEQAHDVLTLAQWHDPDDMHTFGLVARLALRQGDRARAVSALRTILQRNPDMTDRDRRLLAPLTRS